VVVGLPSPPAFVVVLAVGDIVAVALVFVLVLVLIAEVHHPSACWT
jgi:hypothetical protein